MRDRLSSLLKTLLLALALLMGGADSLVAQPIGVGADYEPRLVQRWFFSVAGALTLAVPTFFASDDRPGPGTQRRRTAAAAAAGALLGYAIGWERDVVLARLASIGPPVPFLSEERALEFRPQRLEAAGPDGVLVLGESGMAALTADLELIRRGGEIRGITGAAAFWDQHLLLAAVPAGLYGFSLRRSGIRHVPALGHRLSHLNASLLVPLSREYALAAVSDSLIRLSVESLGREVDDQHWRVSREAAVPAPVRIETLVAAERRVWTLEGINLQARDPVSLGVLASLELPVAGRRLAVSDGLAAVAAGVDGVYLVDVENVRAPRILGQPRLEAVRYVGGVALDGGNLYVAAGAQGMIVVNVEVPSNPRVLGVVRGVGAVDDVIAGPAGLYVIERQGQRVQRIGLTTGVVRP